MSDSIDKRFCFDVIPQEKPQNSYTFQALSEEDRKLWLDAMDGKEPPPQYQSSSNHHGSGSQLSGSLLSNSKGLSKGSSGTNSGPGITGGSSTEEQYPIDDFTFLFIRKCIQVIEANGLEDQGLYRVGGVTSRVNKLLEAAHKARKKRERHRSRSRSRSPSGSGSPTFEFENSEYWEVRTVSSALKTYLRGLNEPVMTFRLHQAFIAAASKLDVYRKSRYISLMPFYFSEIEQENRQKRCDDIHALVHKLPKENFELLHMIIRHLAK